MSTNTTTRDPSATVHCTSNRRSENAANIERSVPSIWGFIVNRGIASTSRPFTTTSNSSSTRARHCSLVMAHRVAALESGCTSRHSSGHGKELPGAGNSFELVVSMDREREARAGDEVGNRARDEYLARLRECLDARRNVYGEPADI